MKATSILHLGHVAFILVGSHTNTSISIGTFPQPFLLMMFWLLVESEEEGKIGSALPFLPWCIGWLMSFFERGEGGARFIGLLSLLHPFPPNRMGLELVMGKLENHMPFFPFMMMQNGGYLSPPPSPQWWKDGSITNQDAQPGWLSNL